MSILLLATFETKREETSYMIDALQGMGLDPVLIDLSLNSNGAQWSAAEKLAAMEQASSRALHEIMTEQYGSNSVVVAIGGGTGGQMALQVLHELPLTMKKIFVSTLPFDPRYAVSDTSIILVPAIADLFGLNSTTRLALDQACQIAKSLDGYTVDPKTVSSIGVTSLGVTGAGCEALHRELCQQNHEVTMFHANGFGGAAFARWAKNDAFHAVIDYTPHEVTRCHIAGAHVEMPHRFTAMGHVPRVLLPGGVNFIGLGQASLMPDEYKKRPHYSHSPLFTHVKCTESEVMKCASVIGAALEQSSAPIYALIPMGGFSSEDCPGGAIEDQALRAVFADHLERYVPVDRIDAHINDLETAQAAVAALNTIIKG